MRGNLSKHNNINSNDFASTDILDSLMPFDDNNNNQQHQQQSQQENPFKYSKEFMLGLFKPALQLPSDFKQHEYVTMEGCTAPLAFEELTDAEKKVILGYTINFYVFIDMISLFFHRDSFFLALSILKCLPVSLKDIVEVMICILAQCKVLLLKMVLLHLEEVD